MAEAPLDEVKDVLRRIALDRRARVALVIGVVALVAWRSWFVGTNWRLQDFSAYRRGSWGLFHLDDPYAARAKGSLLPFIYPTFAALFLAPITLLPLAASQTAMTALTLGLLVFTSWLAVTRVVRRDDPSALWWTAIVAVVGMLSEPYKLTIGLGQVNTVLLALVLVDVLLLRGRRGAGVLIGIATGIKITPAIFIVYLLLRRQWVAARNAAATAAGTVLLGLAIAPGPTWRYFRNGDFLFSVSEVGKSSNQSILGGLARLTHDVDTARPFWIVAVVAVLGLAWWTVPKVADRHGELAGVSLTAVVALTVAPTSWTHYWIWWPVIEVVLVGMAVRTRAFGPTVAAAAWPIAFYFGVRWFAPYPELPDYDHGFVASVLDRCYVVVGLVLVVAMAVWAREESADGIPPGPPGGVSGGAN